MLTGNLFSGVRSVWWLENTICVLAPGILPLSLCKVTFKILAFSLLRPIRKRAGEGELSTFMGLNKKAGVRLSEEANCNLRRAA